MTESAVQRNVDVTEKRTAETSSPQKAERGGATVEATVVMSGRIAEAGAYAQVHLVGKLSLVVAQSFEKL